VLALATTAALALGTWRAIKLAQTSPVDSPAARQEVMTAASQATVKLLSYTPATVESDMSAARDLTTDPFKSSYTELTKNVVIPGAKEKSITAVATIPASAVESLSATTAAVIVFVNQTTTTGQAAPTMTASSVRVGMVKINGKWLIKTFDPL
jgi:Mce-associated membrane protein